MSGSCDIAWAAGLFEGEGCISLASFGKRRTIYLMLSTTDQDVLERFVGIVGCGTLRKLRRPGAPKHYKPLFEWRIGTRADVERVLEMFMPYLGKRRAAKARKALREASPISGKGSRERSKTHCKHGHKFTEANTYLTSKGHRQCKRCRDRRLKQYKSEGRFAA